MIYKGKFYYLQISFLERKYILFILYLLIYQLVPSVTHLLCVTVWAMYVQVRALCVCAKARGRHSVPGCATLCLIHVRQCLSLNLCSLVLARLAGHQAPGISVPHPPAQLVQVLEAMLAMYVGAQDPKPGTIPVQQGLSPTDQSLQLGNAS